MSDDGMHCDDGDEQIDQQRYDEIDDLRRMLGASKDEVAALKIKVKDLFEQIVELSDVVVRRNAMIVRVMEDAVAAEGDSEQKDAVCENPCGHCLACVNAADRKVRETLSSEDAVALAADSEQVNPNTWTCVCGHVSTAQRSCFRCSALKPQPDNRCTNCTTGHPAEIPCLADTQDTRVIAELIRRGEARPDSEDGDD